MSSPTPYELLGLELNPYTISNLLVVYLLMLYYDADY
jgi:hypothetical protein